MKEWKEFQLNELTERFIDYRGKTPQKTSHGIPLITAKIVKNGTILTPNEFIAESDYSKWMRRGFPKINDVVLTTEAPLGEVALLKNENVALAQRIIIIRGKKHKLDNAYLKYYLQCNIGQEELEKRSSGTTVTGIKASELKKISVICPEYDEQRDIAAVLSSLDDKIDLLHRQNATLEDMAILLFTDLFLTEKHCNNYCSIGNYIEFNPKRIITDANRIVFLEMSEVNTNNFAPSKTTIRNHASGTRYKNGDTLLAKITPCLENGKSCYVTFLDNNSVGCGSTEFIVMRANNKLHTFFTYCLVKTDEFLGYAEQCLYGTSGRQRVDLSHLMLFQIVQPTPETISIFNEFVTKILPKMLNNISQIRTLEKLRDTLLPKLMSGEVRVDCAGAG